MYRHAAFRLTFATVLLLSTSAWLVAGSPGGLPGRHLTPPGMGRKVSPQNHGNLVKPPVKPSALRSPSTNGQPSQLRNQLDKSKASQGTMPEKPLAGYSFGEQGEKSVVKPNAKVQPSTMGIQKQGTPSRPNRPQSGIIAILIGL